LLAFSGRVCYENARRAQENALRKSLTAFFVTVGLLQLAAFPATSQEVAGAVAKPEIASRNGVRTLQNQDKAFALTIEAFRQYRVFQIEMEYERRLHAIEGIGKETSALILRDTSQGLQTLNEWLVGLAKYDRDMHFEKLEAQVQNLRAAYDCARQYDERELGVSVPANINTEAASEELKKFTATLVGAPLDKRAVSLPPIPAKALLYDSPQPPVVNEPLAEKCD
jgi:hypothetical protein